MRKQCYTDLGIYALLRGFQETHIYVPLEAHPNLCPKDYCSWTRCWTTRWKNGTRERVKKTNTRIQDFLVVYLIWNFKTSVLKLLIPYWCPHKEFYVLWMKFKTSRLESNSIPAKDRLSGQGMLKENPNPMDLAHSSLQ